MRRWVKSAKSSGRNGAQAGVAMLEAAIAISTFTLLFSVAVALVLQLRFDSLAYEALRQSTLELIQWRPPRNIRNPNMIPSVQCEQFGAIITAKLRNVGLDPETVSFELRSASPNPQNSRVLQQLRIKSRNSSLAPFFTTKSVNVNYLPTANVGVVHCRQRGSSTIEVTNGE